MPQNGEERYYHQALSHNGRLYVLGGDADAATEMMCGRRRMVKTGRWKPLAQIGRRRWGHQALSHNGRLYVLGGYDGNFSNPLNDVWSSADGKNWSLEDNAEWARRSLHQALSHNGRLYVLGGMLIIALTT